MRKRPNFLIFMTDHQRGDTLRPDHPCITPNIDRFRPRAVNFQQAFCSAPHCCPSRASFFTGLYPAQHGVWNNVDVDNALSRGLYDGVRCFSQDLREAGYALYFSGKWHISQHESPEARGFELLHHDPGRYRAQGNLPQAREWARYAGQRLDTESAGRAPGQILRPGYPEYRLYGIRNAPGDDENVVEAAVKKLDNLSGAQPFCMFVGPIGPHDPYYVPQKYYDLYENAALRLPENFADSLADKPALYRRTHGRFAQLSPAEHLEAYRCYLAYCSYEDALFGRLLDALEASGHRDDTVILYCSDHGDYAGGHGLWAKGLPCFREAYDICAMMGGPGILRPGRVENALVSIADFAPTFLELAGVAPRRPMLGQSLAPFLRDAPPPCWRQAMFSQTNGNEAYGIQRAVWDGRWKYVFNSFDFDELYDLRADPGELRNLLHGEDPLQGPHRDTVRALWKKLWAFARQTGDTTANAYIMTALAPYGPGILEETASGGPLS